MILTLARRNDIDMSRRLPSLKKVVFKSTLEIMHPKSEASETTMVKTTGENIAKSIFSLCRLEEL